MGCWGLRGQQADLLPLPPSPTQPLFSGSALSVDPLAGQRAEGSGNEPPEPGAALLFMSTL